MFRDLSLPPLGELAHPLLDICGLRIGNSLDVRIDVPIRAIQVRAVSAVRYDANGQLGGTLFRTARPGNGAES